MQIEIRHPEGKWIRPENDGRVLIASADGRRFWVREKDGALTLESIDGELLIHPISRTQIGIETPTS